MADPVEVERLEILVRREMKQHHDEQHLGTRELARTLPCLLRRDQPVRFPVLEHLQKSSRQQSESRDIGGH